MAGEYLSVRMAEMGVTTNDTDLKTVLGSCVAIILRDEGKRISGLAHIMLPVRLRSDDCAGKYADSAIPELLSRMTDSGARRGTLAAMLVGGGRMFPATGFGVSIGDQNLETSRRILRELGIPVIYEDTGGTFGRSVVLSNVTGKVHVRTLTGLSTSGGEHR